MCQFEWRRNGYKRSLSSCLRGGKTIFFLYGIMIGVKRRKDKANIELVNSVTSGMSLDSTRSKSRPSLHMSKDVNFKIVMIELIIVFFIYVAAVSWE